MWTSISILIAIVLLVLLAFALFSPSRGKPCLSYGEHGLWDLYFGAILLILAVAERFDLSVVAFVPILLYPVLLAAKRTFTAPRLSAAELLRVGGGMRASERRTLLYLAVGLALPLALLLAVRLLGSLPAWLRYATNTFLPVALWLVLAGLLATWGYRSGMLRLIVYAAVLAVVPLGVYLVDLPSYAAGLLMGTTVTAGGLFVLSRFVHTHPTHGQIGGI